MVLMRERLVRHRKSEVILTAPNSFLPHHV
jgi:hypothetical protein